MPAPLSNAARPAAALVLGVLAALAVHAAVTPASTTSPEVEAPPESSDVRTLAHAVTVRGPSSAPGVIVGADPRTGAPLLANCTTCHATRPPVATTRIGADLDDFHQGLVMEHGGLTCLTCHDARAYDRLRLADGTSVQYSESLRLCAQCHGPQVRDWRNGSHGGMSGYWDLERGPRVRNHCLVCHDPHAPAIGQVLPAPPPNDRFLREATTEAHHDE